MVDSPHGSFHSHGTARNMAKLGADEEILSWIRTGVPVTFNKGTNLRALWTYNPPYEGEDLAWMNSKVEAWWQKGFVTEIKRSDVKVHLGLCIATRWDHQSQAPKRRLCLNGKSLKGKISFGTIKLPDVQYLANFITEDSYIAISDAEVLSILKL